MFDQLKRSRQTHWLAEAFATLPRPAMSPQDAYQRLLRGQIEHVALGDLANRILATSVVPHTPGTPMLMPGEATGPADGPYLSYLRALSSWNGRFPGFGHAAHGVECRNGTWYVQCLKSLPRHKPRRTEAEAGELVAR
jgi:arginine/lysine/ornithine decarboxylase